MQDRVSAAYAAKEKEIAQKFLQKGLQRKSPVFFRAFKAEKELELWVKKEENWTLYEIYPICKVPGELGPKQKEGDNQVPEGVYFINRFNPKSTYLLSL